MLQAKNNNNNNKERVKAKNAARWQELAKADLMVDIILLP